MNLKNFLFTVISCFSLFNATAQPCGLIPNATYYAPACSGRPLYLFGTAAGTGVSYSWTGPNSFTSNLQNPIVPSPNFTPPAGPGSIDSFVLTVQKIGCTPESTKIYLVIGATEIPPSIKLIDNPACTGDTMTLLAGIPPAIAAYYHIWNNTHDTSGLFAKLILRNLKLSDTGWYHATVYTDFVRKCVSDTSHFYISASDIMAHPLLTAPSVNVTPGTTVAKGNQITYKTILSNAGTKPKFQWYRNGVAIPNAKDSTYYGNAGYDVMNNDSISVRLIRSPNCIDTAYSSFTKMTITTLGISTTASERQSVIYPNPNKGSFTIIGHYANQEQVTICVTNTLGQVVYQLQITVQKANELVIKTDNLSAGVYCLSLQTGKLNETLRLVIE